MSEEQHSKPIIVTFPDKSTMSKVVDLGLRARPINWSRKSRAPYYKKCFGEWLKKTVDVMIVDRKNRVFLKEHFKGMSEHTLYLRVHQSLMYLIEQMDENGKYLQFKEETRIRKKQGVVIEFRDKIADELGAEAVEFIPEKHTPKWKKELDEWIESADSDPFIRANLLLSPVEIEQLEMELSGLSNIMYSINCREIKVVRA